MKSILDAGAALKKKMFSTRRLPTHRHPRRLAPPHRRADGHARPAALAPRRRSLRRQGARPLDGELLGTISRDHGWGKQRRQSSKCTVLQWQVDDSVLAIDVCANSRGFVLYFD